MSTRLARRRPFRSPRQIESPFVDDDALVFTPDGLGHESYVEVVLSGPIDRASGMIMDIRAVDLALEAALAPFERGAPAATAVLAAELFEILRDRFAGVTLEKLRVYETADAWVDVWP